MYTSRNAPAPAMATKSIPGRICSFFWSIGNTSFSLTPVSYHTPHEIARKSDHLPHCVRSKKGAARRGRRPFTGTLGGRAGIHQFEGGIGRKIKDRKQRVLGYLSVALDTIPVTTRTATRPARMRFSTMLSASFRLGFLTYL